jgi:hypothetical protein
MKNTLPQSPSHLCVTADRPGWEHQVCPGSTRYNSAKTTLDRYGHLMLSNQNDEGVRLDQTVFGNSVRKSGF